MQKAIILITLLLFVIGSFGQQSTTTPTPKTNTDYLQKSKKQKTTAWIMLGGGAALVIVGIVIPQGESTGVEFDPYSPSLSSEGHKNDDIKVAFALAGVLSTLGSIPFFIASGKNNRKAASLSFINMRAPQIKNSSMVYKPIPAVSLKVTL